MIDILNCVIQAFPNSVHLDEVRDLRRRAFRMQISWINNLYVSMQCTVSAVGIRSSCVSLCQASNRGRPMIAVNLDQVELLCSAGYTWCEVAGALLVSRTTIWRRV